MIVLLLISILTVDGGTPKAHCSMLPPDRVARLRAFMHAESCHRTDGGMCTSNDAKVLWAAFLKYEAQHCSQ